VVVVVVLWCTLCLCGFGSELTELQHLNQLGPAYLADDCIAVSSMANR